MLSSEIPWVPAVLGNSRPRSHPWTEIELEKRGKLKDWKVEIVKVTQERKRIFLI